MTEALDRATPAELLAHLQACDAHFVPPLSARVDLADYASKLHARARRVESWDGARLCGLIALYADNPGDGGFISNVSVLPDCQGRGLAAALLARTLQWAAHWQLPRLRLEVHAGNAAALALYRRHGFREEGRRGDSLFLTRDIP